MNWLIAELKGSWWPFWMLLTTCILLFAVYKRDQDHIAGLLFVLVGLIFSRIAVEFISPEVAMMAVWACVAFALFSKGLYMMAGFSALSAIAYFPLWGSFFVADIMGLLMLLCASGGIYANIGSVSTSGGVSPILPSEASGGVLHARASKEDI